MNSFQIAFLTDGIFPYVTGGMQRHSYYLVKNLAENNVKVTLFHCQNNPEYDISKLEFFTDQQKNNIESIVIPFPSLGSFPGHYLKESYNYSVLIFDSLKESLNNYDIVYSKGFCGWKLLEEKNKGLKAPPVAVKFHGYEMFQEPPSFKALFEQRLLLRKPVKKMNLMADFVFSYGGKITQLISSLGVESKKIIEISSGIEASWVKEENNIKINSPIKFLFIGRFERRKGIEELSNAIPIHLRTHNSEFHFIGPIPEKKKIRLEKVHYYGEIRDKERLIQIFDQCDVLICPSKSEGMPNVILEAMSRGLAIVATDVGAVSEMVNEENGILLNGNSPEEIIKALDSICNLNHSEWRILKINSLKKIMNKFLWEKVVLQTINSFQGIISK